MPAIPEAPQTSILVIYTGGTAGMAYNKRGELVPMKFEQIRRKMPELRQLNMQVDVTNLGEPIDSSNVTTGDWLRMAALIAENYDRYDGFVVLHGTDTMAYSAAALSFLLENLGKTVVFTGAQVPVGRIRTDARRNLVTALEMAASRHPMAKTVRVPEVCLFFNDLLIRGNRAKKVESQQYDAFRSENYPPLARAGIELDFNDEQIRLLPAAPLRVHERLDERVTILRLFPGLTERMVRAQLEVADLRGCVLETYGSGNAPTAPWFLRCLREAADRGVLLLQREPVRGGPGAAGPLRNQRLSLRYRYCGWRRYYGGSGHHQAHVRARPQRQPSPGPPPAGSGFARRNHANLRFRAAGACVSRKSGVILRHLTASWMRTQRGVRVVEGARLESVYGSKAHRGFESHPLYIKPRLLPASGVFAFRSEAYRQYNASEMAIRLPLLLIAAPAVGWLGEPARGAGL